MTVTETQMHPTDTSLIGAIGRLDRAVALLESRMRALQARAASGVEASALHQAESARQALEAELEAAHQRELALAEAAASAHEALGRAADDVRRLLQDEEARAHG